MAPKYTLTYFNVRGYAEISRLILAKAGVEYEDKRVEKENWPELKNGTPYGHLPVLTINNDGVQIAESRAIARFLAREHGLAGKNSVESAQADAIVDFLYDVAGSMVSFRRETDLEKKKELLEKVATEVLPPFFKIIENTLQKNGTGFLVGDSLTWADLAVANLLWQINLLSPLDSQKSLVDFEKKILSLPGIKEWIEKRPQTEF